MIVNYMNVLLKGTSIAAQLVHGEVRYWWYYNWLGRCERLKTAGCERLKTAGNKMIFPLEVVQNLELRGTHGLIAS